MSMQIAVAALQATMQNVTLNAPPQPKGKMELVKRPAVGKAGRALQLYANYFKVTFAPTFTKQVFHYDVTITPVREGEQSAPKPGTSAEQPGVEVQARNVAFPAKLARKLVLQVAQEENWAPGWGFDGKKNIYAPSAILPQAETEHLITFQDSEDGAQQQARARQFKITTIWVNTIQKDRLDSFLQGTGENPRDLLQALDICFRHTSASHPNCTPVGRSLYWYDSELVGPIGGAAEAWMGYTQAIKACQAGLCVNLDVACTAFLQAKPLIDVMLGVSGRRRPEDMMQGSVLRTLTRSLRGVRVEKLFPAKKKRAMIMGFSDRGADALMFFNDKEKRNQSVAEYFAATNRRLKFPKLPCANIGGKDRITGRPKEVWIPVELLKVNPGQRRLKLDEKQTAEMITFAKQFPEEKREFIEYAARDLARFNKDPVLEAWGMQVASELMLVNARVLPAPKLSYTQPEAIDPGNSGSWNLRNVKFVQGAQLTTWGVVSLAERRDVDIPGPSGLVTFLKDMVQMLQACGLTVAMTQPPVVYYDRSRSVEDHMRAAVNQAQAATKQRCQIIMVLLRDKGVEMYKEVKRISDGMLGVPSQCFVMKSAGIGNFEPRGRPQYCANVAMKMNMKLKGRNVRLAGGPATVPVLGKLGPFMIFGADVTHPTSRNTNEPSVAAVVGSLEGSLSRYTTRVLIQEHRKEIIVDLQKVVQEMLREFYTANGGKAPTNLVFFRDGVADNQFQAVLEYEYAAIRRACASMGNGTYSPGITFIVVQKRHTTRFFPKDPRDGDKNGNVMPGTVVDQTICSPRDYDFFLNSHAGLLGTNRSAHYHVLVDEIGFGPDGIQLLTYWLCYLYARCTRSVSFCPPAYYAHLAAFRGRIMVRMDESASDTASVASGGEGAMQFADIRPELADAMFYM